MEHVARIPNTEHQENDKNKNLVSSTKIKFNKNVNGTAASTHQLDKLHDERFCGEILSCKSHFSSVRQFSRIDGDFTPVVNAMLSPPYHLKCLFIRAGTKIGTFLLIRYFPFNNSIKQCNGSNTVTHFSGIASQATTFIFFIITISLNWLMI